MALLTMFDSSPTRIRLLALLAAGVLGCTAAAADDMTWRPIDPADTAILELDEGTVVIELNPLFAPKTVAQFKRLARQGFYDGESFYRVIDGFVAQGGDGSDIGVPNPEPTIGAEFDRAWADELPFIVAQAPDLFAPETGFVDGFPAGRDPESGTVWLTHCPGAVAMARLDDPDSGSTDFYIVIGQAPRYLDRNLSIFGRVVYGMESVQRLRRGAPSANGIIDDAAKQSTIRRIRIATDLSEGERPRVEVMDTSSEAFRSMLQARRDRDAPFFVKTPPAMLDVCQVPNQGRM